VTSESQTKLFWKEPNGWQWTETTAYSLERPETDLTLYIEQFSYYYVTRAIEKGGHLGQIFWLAAKHRSVGFFLTQDFITNESLGFNYISRIDVMDC